MIIRKLLFVVALLGSFSVFAQDKKDDVNTGYTTSVGVRLGYNPGFTLKHFINSSVALEGIAHTRFGGGVITGLIEKHAPAFDEEGLHWFYGVGGHVGFYKRWGYGRGRYYGYDNEFRLGIDGILGIEYVIKDIPFTVGLDIKPYFDIIHPIFNVYDGALTVRYRF